MSEVLTDLLSRVEAATGPDRELDVRLCLAFNGPDTGINETMPYVEENVAYFMGLVADANPWTPDWTAYTASLDAALALVERALPGWEWGV